MLASARWQVGAGWAVVAALGGAIGALPFYLSASLVVVPSVVLLALARPELGVGLLAMAVPFSVFRELTVGGFAITPTEFLVGMMLLVWVIVVGVRRRLHIGPLAWPIALFLGVLVLSFTATTNKTLAVKEMLRWAELLAAYLVTATIINEPRRMRPLLAALLVAGSIEALMGWAQFFGRLGPDAFKLGPFLRAYGTFGQPNPYGGYLGMVLPLAAALALLWRKSPEAERDASPDAAQPFRLLPEVSETALRRLAAISAVLMGAAMLMSMSRGAWMGAFVALSLIAVARGRRSALVLAAILLVLVLVVLAGALNVLPDVITDRLSTAISYFGVFDVRYVEPTTENWPVVERMAQWQVAWEMFQEQYYLGVGAGNYVETYPKYALKDWTKPLGHAHNIYLHIAAEMGLIGLGAYLLMVLSWLWVAVGQALNWWRLAPRSDAWAVMVGCLAVLLAVGIHNLFDNLYVHGMNVHMGLLLGLIVLRGSNGEQ